jgi:hypothetical protein
MRGLVVWLKDLERGMGFMVAEKILSGLVLGGMVAFMILGCSLDFRFFGCGGREDTMVGVGPGFLRLVFEPLERVCSWKGLAVLKTMDKAPLPRHAG